MENKKLGMFSKEAIISGVQFFLISYMVVMGFIFTYLLIWFAIDSLPREPWAMVVCTVAGILSMIGLFAWLAKNNVKEVSKKDMCENAKSICNGECESCAWHE